MRILSILFLSLFLTGASLNDARKANNAFENGNYAEAAELYQQAIAEDPENPHLHFNLARTLYELGQDDAAMEAYDQFKNLTENPGERSYADYNKGRMLTDQEKYQEAVDFFKEALKNNPNDSDAKYNYELARQKQQEQSQQEQQEDSESDSNEGDEDQENSDQQDNQQDQEPDPNSESNQQPGQPEEEDGDSQEQPQPLEMTPEEAKNILDALQQLERELLENQKKESTEPPSGNEKDW